MSKACLPGFLSVIPRMSQTLHALLFAFCHFGLNPPLERCPLVHIKPEPRLSRICCAAAWKTARTRCFHANDHTVKERPHLAFFAWACSPCCLPRASRNLSPPLGFVSSFRLFTVTPHETRPTASPELSARTGHEQQRERQQPSRCSRPPRPLPRQGDGGWWTRRKQGGTADGGLGNGLGPRDPTGRCREVMRSAEEFSDDALPTAPTETLDVFAFKLLRACVCRFCVRHEQQRRAARCPFMRRGFVARRVSCNSVSNAACARSNPNKDGGKVAPNPTTLVPLILRCCYSVILVWLRSSRLFERFFRADTTGAEGTGLGLTM